MKKWVASAAIGAGLGAALYGAGCYYFNRNFHRLRHPEKKLQSALNHVAKTGPEGAREQIQAGMEWLDTQPHTCEEIRSFDGLTLRAKFYAPPEGIAPRTIVMAHGYMSAPKLDFSCACAFFRDLGWNLLLIDQRAHGESEGTYITFGAKEQYDVRDWCLFLRERFGAQHRLVLDGISMGCTTVLLAGALPDLPDNVRGIIADCGFVTPWDEFVHVMRQDMHLPPFPMLYIVEGICRHRAGFGFRDHSTINAVQQLRVPVLFIHGEQDTFVPPINTLRNYEACCSEKELILVPQAGHGICYLVDTPRCQAALIAFLERAMQD